MAEIVDCAAVLNAPIPHALEELEQAIGREQPLDSYHSLLRRAAQSVRTVERYGCCLVSCSDEFNGELRYVFDRDVGRPLTARHVARHHGTFPLSNLSGRYEPGTFALVHDHFAGDQLGEPDGEETLLLIEIAAHLGRYSAGHETVYGQIDRFGRNSPCCGALAAVIAPPPLVAAVTHPWFDKLTTYFGEERLAQLRAMPRPEAMIRAAVVHAAMQAEAAVAEVLREAPRANTWTLIAPLVKINQPGVYGALPVGYHLLRSTTEATRIEAGLALRTTPAALAVSTEGGGLQVALRDPGPGGDRTHARETAPAAPEGASPRELIAPHREAVRREVLETRTQMEPLRSSPEAWRVFARPLLRSLFQGLTLVSPEVGLAAMMVETGSEWVQARQRYAAHRHGPGSAEGRQALREVEAAIQQLGHSEAQAVLECLTADGSPLVSG